jgi:hypothetical protein
MDKRTSEQTFCNNSAGKALLHLLHLLDLAVDGLNYYDLYLALE